MARDSVYEQWFHVRAFALLGAGFSDKEIAELTGASIQRVRTKRRDLDALPPRLREEWIEKAQSMEQNLAHYKGANAEFMEFVEDFTKTLRMVFGIDDAAEDDEP